MANPYGPQPQDPATSTSANPANLTWHAPGGAATPEDRARALLAETASIANNLSAEVTRSLGLATYLSGRSRIQYRMPVQPLMTPTSDLDIANPMDENLLFEIYDATLSSAASNPLIPTPQGRGAMFRLARAMRHAGRWLASVWEDLDAESACLDAFAHAFEHGWGAVRVRYDQDAAQVALDPVRVDQLVVSQAESSMGPLGTMRLQTKLPPGMLKDLYGIPDDHEDRKDGPGKDHSKPVDGLIVEAWRLPRGGRPGCHMLVAGSGMNVRVLTDEEWTETWFPVVVFHWRRQGIRAGFFDVGAVEQILPYHNQLTELNRRIRTAQRICTAPRLLAHVSAQLQVSSLDSEEGRVFTHKGAAPTPLVWPTNLQDLYQERIRCKERAYEASGTSQFASGQDLPPGFRADSSAAVREVQMMEDKRKLDLWTRFQKFRMTVGSTILQVQAKYGKDKEVRYLRGRKARWDRAAPLLQDANKGMWSLRPLPAQADSLAANRATVEEMLANGLLSEKDRKYLAGHPDPEIIFARARAPIDDVDRIVEDLEDGDYTAPDQVSDLEYGQYAVTAALLALRGSEDRADHTEVEELMVTWLGQAQSILKAEADAAAKAQMALQAQAQQPGPPAPATSSPQAPTLAPGAQLL